jgi:hypothetical protein
MTAIGDRLRHPNSDWEFHDTPLGIEAIATAQSRIRIQLPQSLIDLYRHCNSGTGSIPFDPWYFDLWGIDVVADLREHPHYREFYQDYVFFASSGGGCYFALDSSGSIYVIDPIAGADSRIKIADSFDEFIEAVGHRAQDLE